MQSKDARASLVTTKHTRAAGALDIAPASRLPLGGPLVPSASQLSFPPLGACRTFCLAVITQLAAGTTVRSAGGGGGRAHGHHC